jgi:hypothetical protein
MAAPTRLSAGLDRLGDANLIARALATLRVLTPIMPSAWQMVSVWKSADRFTDAPNGTFASVSVTIARIRRVFM